MHLESIRKILHHCYNRQEDIGPEYAFRFALIIGPKRQPITARYCQVSSPRSSPQQIPTDTKGKGRQRDITTDSTSGLSHPESDPPGPSDTATSRGNSPTLTNEPEVESNEHYLRFPDWPSRPTETRVSDNQVVYPSATHSTRSEVDQTRAISARADGLPNEETPIQINPYPRPRPTYNRPKPPINDDHSDMTPDIAVLQTASGSTSSESDSSSAEDQPPDGEATQIEEPDEIAYESEAESARPRTPVPSTPPVATKRTATDISPMSPRQTRPPQKRKIITADDRAAMEAKEIMVGTTRKRRIRTRT